MVMISLLPWIVLGLIVLLVLRAVRGHWLAVGKVLATLFVVALCLRLLTPVLHRLGQPAGIHLGTVTPAADMTPVQPMASADIPLDDAAQLPARQQLFSDTVDTWRADLYPSDRAAVHAVLTRLDRQWISGPGYREPAEIRVQGTVGHELLVSAVDLLRKSHPTTPITFWQTQDDPAAPAGGDAVAVIRLEIQYPVDRQSKAAVRASIDGVAGSISEQASFLDKSWADDYATFASRDPNRSYIVAISQRPATSAEEAYRDAVAVAVPSLRQRIVQRMDRQAGGAFGKAADFDQIVSSRIAAELQAGRMIADKFVQRLQASYGEVWQTSLLIDASNKNIDDLARQFDRLMAVQTRGTRQTILAAAGVIALVCLVYVFLNIATKGYFVWSLRAMALAMIAAGVFLVMLFCR